MRTRSPGPARPRSKTAAAGHPAAARQRTKPGKAGAFEDVAARAARLGITVEKVLLEYARIAFGDPRHIAGWDESGVHVKASGELSDADVATIHEISGGATGAVHVKLYDKKAALDAIARHLGMFPTASRERSDAKPDDSAEDPREQLKRRLARLAASLGEGTDR